MPATKSIPKWMIERAWEAVTAGEIKTFPTISNYQITSTIHAFNDVIDEKNLFPRPGIFQATDLNLFPGLPDKIRNRVLSADPNQEFTLHELRVSNDARRSRRYLLGYVLVIPSRKRKSDKGTFVALALKEGLSDQAQLLMHDMVDCVARDAVTRQRSLKRVLPAKITPILVW